MFNQQIASLPEYLSGVRAITILDSTKCKTYQQCPRLYFFSHILGWKAEHATIHNHLIFGQALHKAMESLMHYGYTKEAVHIGMLEFEKIYRKDFPPVTDAQHYPKVPARATDALMAYIQKYKEDNFSVLHTEKAGIIYVREDRELHFKMDLIAKNKDGIFFNDYKTASRLTPSWMNQWTLSTQINLYTHGLHCLFSEEEIFGGIIQGLIFMKNETKLVRVPVRRTYAQLNAWLWGFNILLDDMERNFNALVDVKDTDSFMQAFPQNPNACSSFYGCPFFDLCSAGNQNPMSYAAQCPLGYKVEHWDPTVNEEKKEEIGSC